MQNKTDEIKSLSIQNLFENSNYIVPIYQRSYAWGELEITQLIDDIYDYSEINGDNNYYYIGSLVVYKRADGKLEVIDGQQRLTTLFILLHVLKSIDSDSDTEILNLHFESRKKSTLTLEKVASRNIQRDNKTEFKIIDAYEEIQKKLNKKNINIKKFKNYLLKYVVILRTEVPQDTDLNHYFEIMNNRGEQLEKHEILKSRMLEKLSKNNADMEYFNLIWEACSNMEKYVQYAFPIDLRNKIFGQNTWNDFNITNFDGMKLEEKNEKNKENESISLSELVANNHKIQNPNEDKKAVDSDTPARFTSVISFPNFLLHVLKIQETKDKEIPLDDKRLLETFVDYYKDSNAVKIFAFNLLKLRFLFDKYITKREYTSKGDQWSLKQLIKNENSNNNTAYYKNTFGNEDITMENKNILMLLTMFHVSYPTQIYKHWLSGVLNYLFIFEKIEQVNYQEYLEELAKKYMIYRYLSKEPSDFQEIIFKTIKEQKNLEYDNLDKGTDVENFIFNYIDYLLWKRESQEKNSFEFAFRTSVEHYYPQHPMEGVELLQQDILDSFGNLCLISSSENSRLSNLSPKAKKDFYLKQKNQSLKQRHMMEFEEWGDESIKEHKVQMVSVLKKAFDILEDKDCHEYQ